MKSSAIQSRQPATKMKWFNWQGSGAGWFKAFLFTLALFIVPLAIVLSAVELAFRYVNRSNAVEIPDYTENSTYMPLRVKGNYQGVVGGIPITTNSHGFRDEPEFDPTPPAGEFRILSMGDSIAFGLTLDSSDTYAKVLERHLNARLGGLDYNVINTAGPGYDPSSYYLFLKNEALEWQPDMVIVEVELTNDVTDAAFVEWQVDPSNPSVPVRLKGGRYITAWDGTLLSAYVRGPYFYEKTYTYVELSRRILNLLYQNALVKPFPTDTGSTYYTLGHEGYLLDEQRIESGLGTAPGCDEGNKRSAAFSRSFVFADGHARPVCLRGRRIQSSAPFFAGTGRSDHTVCHRERYPVSGFYRGSRLSRWPFGICRYPSSQRSGEPGRWYRTFRIHKQRGFGIDTAPMTATPG